MINARAVEHCRFTSEELELLRNELIWHAAAPVST
jgi:hypothetical protein